MASPAYERRNARARALGYSSYYDYRAHDNGRIAPDKARLSGPALARARGHNSAADLTKAAKRSPGSLVTATPDLSSRRPDGSYSRIYITMIDADGNETEYLIRSSTIDVDKLLSDLNSAGAVFSPNPSLDIAAAIGESDDDDEPDDLEYELIDFDDIDDGIPF